MYPQIVDNSEFCLKNSVVMVTLSTYPLCAHQHIKLNSVSIEIELFMLWGC